LLVPVSVDELLDESEQFIELKGFEEANDLPPVEFVTR
jgi:hypothetical protein